MARLLLNSLARKQRCFPFVLQRVAPYLHKQQYYKIRQLAVLSQSIIQSGSKHRKSEFGPCSAAKLEIIQILQKHRPCYQLSFCIIATIIMKDDFEQERLYSPNSKEKIAQTPKIPQNIVSSPICTQTATRLSKLRKVRYLFPITVICFLGLLNLLFVRVHRKKQVEPSISLPVRPSAVPQMHSKPQQVVSSRFPKIFWVYTENEFGSESMNEQIYFQLFNHTGVQSGYEVRLANSWNAYDWLSNQTTTAITKAMHNSKVDEGVHNLLKIALLMEHGGMLINQIDIVMLGNGFAWLHDMFQSQEKHYQETYVCEPTSSYLFMSRSPRESIDVRYYDNFVAAVPHSRLLKQAFEALTGFITNGKLPCSNSANIIRRNIDTKVDYIIDSFQETINCIVADYRAEEPSQLELCKMYGIQEKKQPNYASYAALNDTQKRRILLTVDPEFYVPKAFNLPAVNYMWGMNSGPIIGIIQSLLRAQLQQSNEHIEDIKPGSLAFRIINAAGNKEVFIDALPAREVNFCIVVMNQLETKQQFQQAFRLAKDQVYQKWKQVMFAKDVNSVPRAKDGRLTILQSNFNEIRNIEVAVTQHCDNKGYAVLLHSHETLTSIHFLTNLAKEVRPRDTLGAFVNLQYKTSVIQPSPEWSHFHRSREAIVQPNMSKLKSIVNHMRVFAIESFRFIPQFDLRNIHGKYFNDRLIFLMTLLEMIRTEIHQPRMLYLIKKYSPIWNVPRKMAIVRNGGIRIDELEEVDEKQLFETRSRLECQEVYENMNNVLRWKIPYSKMLAFNNGDEFVPADKKKGPDLIPKVIHQVWLGTPRLPPAKEYFLRKTQMMYPDFTVKLWREENITKENFPLTYELITNLLNFSKHSPYNKLATVTDIMRHEILALEGGFWKDAGMNLLRPVFQHFTKYKLVLPVDKTFRYRWLQGMCFFANMPGYQNMRRINNFRNLNRMRIYDSYALSIAGPIDFRQLLVGQEEYDPGVLTLPYETFYPAQVTQHPLKDLCTKREEDLLQADSVEIIENGWHLLTNCAELYPFSYAVEHNRFGDSWSKKRPIK